MPENRDHTAFVTAQVEDARKILLDLPCDQVREVVTRVYVETQTDNNVPHAIIFPSDGINVACSRLTATMRGPDPTAHDTVTDPQTNYVEERLKSLVLAAGTVSRPVARAISTILLKTVAGGVEGNAYEIYADIARLFPLHEDRWYELLCRQFNAKELLRGAVTNPDFFTLLAQSRALSLQFAPTPISFNQTILEAQNRLNTAGEHGIDTVIRWIELRNDILFREYREAAYTLRGLEYRGPTGRISQNPL